MRQFCLRKETVLSPCTARSPQLGRIASFTFSFFHSDAVLQIAVPLELEAVYLQTFDKTLNDIDHCVGSVRMLNIWRF